MFERHVSFGKYGQWFAALTVTFCVAISGVTVSWPAAAFPKMEDGSAGFNFTEWEKGWLACLPFTGAVISPLPVAYIMDRIGRRNTLHLSMLLILAGWLIITFSRNIYLMCLARLMCGLFGGTEYITVSIFVAEMVDPSIRGTLISVTGMTLYIGALYVSFISYLSYQTMSILCAVPALCLFTIFFFIPESPYFYLMHGKKKEAEEAITWLRGHCDKDEFKRIEDGVIEQSQNQGTFKEIVVNKANRKAFIMIEWFKIFSSCTANIVLFAFSTHIIPDSFVSAQNSNILLTIIWVFTALFSSIIMDKFPRRTILGVSCVGTIALFTITTIWYYLREFTQINMKTTTWVPLITIIIGSFFEVIGIVNIPNVLKGEIFPINIKTKACAISCMTANVVETINVLCYYEMNYYIGEYFQFLKSVVSASLCLYITVFHMFETKGLDLETIQKLLTGKIQVANKEEEKKSDEEMVSLYEHPASS
ncbi:hypothetical protein GE061_003852 [Apolygus lucorum]|uniref:Major facilitator superfamily (MFS) profile domain-containing protein n=1 Tax=Apolygus lucorum TaxID=248454 RepID=A0A6A4IXL6_APOLU|nr:hypothetical protein GE061_003852 [Apolygus lucorum]